MRFRITAAAIAALGLTLAGSASAADHKPGGPTVQVVVEGPQGVIASADCPSWLYEDDNAHLPELCRPHGDPVKWLTSLGATKVSRLYKGQLAEVAEIMPDGRYAGTLYPGPWIAPGTAMHPIEPLAAPWTQTCQIKDGALAKDTCTRPPWITRTRTPASSAATAKARAKVRAKARAKRHA
jgi:hypothetical protein